MSVNNALFLRPGEYFFGRHNGQVTTLLGSCVAIVVWHPRWHLLGVSHYVLPKDPCPQAGSHDGLTPDTRYGQAVFEQLDADMLRHGTAPCDYRKGIFGGGALITAPGRIASRVGLNNCEFARQQFDLRHWAIDHCDLAGEQYRHLCIDGNNGRIDCQRRAMALPARRRLNG